MPPESPQPEWFPGTPEVVRMAIRTFHEYWKCPQDGCGGEMRYSGLVWIHHGQESQHKCDTCGYKAVIRGQYPRVVTEEVPEK